MKLEQEVLKVGSEEETTMDVPESPRPGRAVYCALKGVRAVKLVERLMRKTLAAMVGRAPGTTSRAKVREAAGTPPW
jgi:uncharacterized ParB-like nuclease family protein